MTSIQVYSIHLIQNLGKSSTGVDLTPQSSQSAIQRADNKKSDPEPMGNGASVSSKFDPGLGLGLRGSSIQHNSAFSIAAGILKLEISDPIINEGISGC